MRNCLCQGGGTSQRDMRAAEEKWGLSILERLRFLVRTSNYKSDKCLRHDREYPEVLKN